MSVAVVGIFVGGASRRMGGFPKGLLRNPSEGTTLIERTLRLAEQIASEVVLVGAREEYAGLGYPMLVDARSGVGPLGGLVTLLAHAGQGRALGVACDMPYLTALLLARLADFEGDKRPIVAPREANRYSTLFARYDAARVLPFAQARLETADTSLQALFNEAGAEELPLDESERRALADWDAPEDIRGGDRRGEHPGP
jgi:molybdopterin-guanine dinucleotide biosynthesis protein A